MEKQSIGQLLKWGKNELRKTGLRTPDLDAEVLLMEVLGVERLVLHVYPEREVKEEQMEDYQAWISRRKAQEPLHYITGKKEFMGLDFHVEKGVLIPRGDTEVVVEAALNTLREIHKKKGFWDRESSFEDDFLQENVSAERASAKRVSAENASAENPARREALWALDIGVGSGAIAVSLLYYMKNLHMIGTDISPIPLKVTKINAENHGVGDRLELLQGSLFEPLDQKFDLIISNPPYISFEVKDGLDREVRDYEPEEALFAKDHGLYYYREIAGQAPFYLTKNGYLIFEIGYDQGDGVRRILQKEGFTGVQILKDLENRDRVVIGKR